MDHEEFARRAGRRLEEAADLLENEERDLSTQVGASKTKARVGELRVAALLVRGEAESVSATEPSPARARKGPAGPPPLEAQG